MVSTPMHEFFIMFPLQIAGGICENSVLGFEKFRGPNSVSAFEDKITGKCPDFDTKDMHFTAGQGWAVESEDSKMSIRPVEGGKWILSIHTPNLIMDALFEQGDRMTWLTPMNENGTKYFAGVKSAGNAILASKYLVRGKKFMCPEKSCLLLTDNFRSHPSYPVNYHFGVLQTKVNDSQAFALVLSDGMGSGFDSLDKATEDFVSLDGKICKLGIVRVSEDDQDIMSTKHIKSTADPSTAKCSCDLIYEPSYQ